MMAAHTTEPSKNLQQKKVSAEATLHNWRNKAKQQGLLLPDSEDDPRGWEARDKFAAEEYL